VTRRARSVLPLAAVALAVTACKGKGHRNEERLEARDIAISQGIDPGPRGGPPSAGGSYTTLNAAEQASFASALVIFKEVTSVSGTILGEPGAGLGPTFNGNSCSLCHAQPAIGGSSPGLRSPQNPVPNPQIALATLHGATNVVPPFITRDGPVCEARFITAPPSATGSPSIDGEVYGLYSIQGRFDAPGCNLAQPDFAAQLEAHNVALRIPTAVFGLGLVENTPDATLQLNLASNKSAKAALGIGGRFNTSGNDGTISKFGWKAQNKSLMVFAAEAYNVEEGVSNENFTNERGAIPGCVFNTTPEDRTGDTGQSSDIVSSAIFMRLSAPPSPALLSPAAHRGSALFDTVGCALCHSRTLRTTASPFTGMSNLTYHPYSDFALHRMGSNLADGVRQGGAQGDEFRTAPLWGIGQRLYFLHDGRATDLGAAIEDHASPGRPCTTAEDYERVNAPAKGSRLAASAACASEANVVVNNYNALTPSQQTDLLEFLRSL
jgi:CxxC motif-containing protein (DUF1111 family)